MRENKIVYTYGVFDLFHYGHLKALKKAKSLGNELIIGVFTDKISEDFKRKPIINEKDRFKLIKELGLGKVVYQKELIPRRKFLYDNSVSLVTKAEGAGWTNKNRPYFGPDIESKLLPYTKGISTTDIIKRVYDYLKQSS